MVEHGREDTEQAMRVMAESVATMRRIAGLIAASVREVTHLSDGSQRIGGIIQVIREIAGTVRAISEALAEQDAAIRQVAVNVERIAQMTGTNSEVAESNNATALELDGLSAQLRESVARFRI